MEQSSVCQLCGKKIQDAEPKEILDGFICRECEKKLSPWFKGYEYWEKKDLQRQIQSREQNIPALRNFRPTRKFGTKPMVLVDDRAGTFVVAQSTHPNIRDLDLISISNVIDCNVDVEEEREKIGNKRYRYSYRFCLEIDLDHPYLEEICFPITEKPMSYEAEEASFLGFQSFEPEDEPDYQAMQRMCQTLEDVLNDMESSEERTHDYDVKPGEFSLSLEAMV